MFGRGRFRRVVEAQLELFEREHADLIAEVDSLLDEYNRSGREEAEERYGDYDDAIAGCRDALAEMRDSYARTLDDPGEYERAFNGAVARRFPRFAFGE